MASETGGSIEGQRKVQIATAVTGIAARAAEQKSFTRNVGSSITVHEKLIVILDTYTTVRQDSSLYFLSALALAIRILTR